MWQPIETVPRDGRKILVLGGFFDTDDQCYGMENNEETGYPVNAYKYGFVIDGGYIANPTHWMPLPEPPTGE